MACPRCVTCTFIHSCWQLQKQDTAPEILMYYLGGNLYTRGHFAVLRAPTLTEGLEIRRLGAVAYVGCIKLF